MRISGRHNSQDYWRLYFTICPVVLLDGVLIEHVCEADDVEGYVVVQAYEGGRPKVDMGRQVFVEERIDGRVQILSAAPE